MKDSKMLIAHRGLHNAEIPENSLAAFQNAVEQGYPMELDVQLTRDGVLVVFHDETLLRVCGVDKRLIDCTFQELQMYRLKDSNKKIPRFSDVLNVVNGKTGILIEIKGSSNWKLATAKLVEELRGYNGLYWVESFHPLALVEFRKRKKGILLGQLSGNMMTDKNCHYNSLVKKILTDMCLNFLSKPDFIAYNYKYRTNEGFVKAKHNKNMIFAAWTVRKQSALEEIYNEFDAFIFEGFIPDMSFIKK